jgi:hypothetical protein
MRNPNAKVHHLTVGGAPYCDWLSTLAGSEIADRTGVKSCGHVSGASAKRSAKALAPAFRAGAVKAVAGMCPAALALTAGGQ